MDENKNEQEKQISISEPNSEENLVYLDDEGEIAVDPEHPEILISIDQALNEATTRNIKLAASDYIDALQIELERLRKERLLTDPTAPMYVSSFCLCFLPSRVFKNNKRINFSDGGWILDNFPMDVDQLKSMSDANFIPDTFIILSDSSNESSILMRRWYSENKSSIDMRINERLAREEEAIRLEEQKKSENDRELKQS